MKSLAVWYEPKSKIVEDESLTPELHLHFNHWKLKNQNSKGKEKYEYLLDIGIRVINGENISTICFFLPQEIQNTATIIEDLGGALTDKRLLTAVFNEKYDPRPVDSQKYFEVKDKEKTCFNIYVLDVSQDIVFKNEFGGTSFKFVNRSYSGLDTYYRIRLKTDFVKQLSYIYRPKNSFIESIFSSVELLDFRVNDTRNLNLSLLEEISIKGKKFNISLIHLFLMRNLNDEYILSDQKLNSVRQLEENTWKNYLGLSGLDNKYKYEKVIAYHLKTKVSEGDRRDKKYIEDFSALLKFRFEDRQLLKYFIYIVLFALTTAIIANGLYEKGKTIFSTLFSSIPFLN